MGRPKIPDQNTFKKRNESPFKNPDFGTFTQYKEGYRMVLDGKTVGRKVKSCPVDTNNKTIFNEG